MTMSPVTTNTNCLFSFTDRRNGNDMSSSMIAALAFAQGKKITVFISFPDRFSKRGGGCHSCHGVAMKCAHMSIQTHKQTGMDR